MPKALNSRPFGPFVQTAYLVSDLKAAAQRWAEDFGAGPFFTLEGIKPEMLGGGDNAASLDHSSAYGQLGDEMIELVVPANGRTSIFDWPLEALHHRAVFATDYEDALAWFEGKGMANRASASVNGMPFAFVDATHQLGHFVEVYPQSDALEGFYAMVRRAADGWDGGDPVRPITL